jgi:hypothetical protein
MSEEIKKDVLDDPSTSPEVDGANVEGETTPENDKDKNFAELRKKSEALEKENKELRERVENGDSARTLADDPKPEKKVEKKEDTLGVLFQRDMKEAVIQWNNENKISTEDWATIKSKISLKGDETLSEIKGKINDVYNSIPTVRAEKDKALVEKGRKEAMQQFRDDELDIGSGGDVNLGDGVNHRHNSKTKSWAKGLGMTDKKLADVDPDGDTGWKEFEEPEIGVKK